MKAVLDILAILLLATSSHGSDAERNPDDQDGLRSYMTGDYDLIGQKADSRATYNGHVTFREEAGVLQVTRTIQDSSEKCTARFDTVAGADRIPVLRMH